nr:MAG TPA: hypothetical protein [Caudoviricetes sp.]
MLLQDKKIVQILHFYFKECYNKRKKTIFELRE